MQSAQLMDDAVKTWYHVQEIHFDDSNLAASVLQTLNVSHWRDELSDRNFIG